MTKFKVGKIVAFLIITIPVLISYFFLNYLNYTATHTDYHFYYVSISAAISFLVSYIAYKEYKNNDINNLYFFSIGFLGLGILYLFYGYITPSLSINTIFNFSSVEINQNMFAILGDLSRLWLAIFLFFSGDFLHKMIKDKDQKLPIIIFSTIGVVLFISVFLGLLNPEIFPAFKNVNGTDSHIAILVKVATLLFLGVNVLKYYYSYKAKPNLSILSFIVGIILLMETSIIFMISTTWSPAWWLAHSVLLLGYIIIGAGILYSHLGKHKIEYFDILGQVRSYVELLKDKNDELDLLANYDVLTGLPNRNFFLATIDEYIMQAKVEKCEFGILRVDLRDLKKINNSYGLKVGDELLKVVASKIDKSVKSIDMASRIDGDEFALLVKDVDHAQLEQIAKRIISKLEEPIIINMLKCQLGSNIGISMFPEDGQTVDVLLKKSDDACYFVKNQGLNNYKFSSHY